MIKPITPEEANVIRGTLYDKTVTLINEAISLNNWHDQHFPKIGYKAIILNLDMPPVMDTVVEDFKKAGWDCHWGHARDARGPHNCFYINENHFENEHKTII